MLDLHGRGAARGRGDAAHDDRDLRGGRSGDPAARDAGGAAAARDTGGAAAGARAAAEQAGEHREEPGGAGEEQAEIT